MSSKQASYRFNSKAQAGVLIGETVERKSVLLEYFELTKPRLSMLSVITAIVGYLAALPDRNALVMMSLVLGTSLAAGGAAALNQWMEREADARMVRTRQRPLPAGTVSPVMALALGLVLCFAGDVLLLIGVNWLAALLAAITQISYLIAYTPLKQRTPWCTEVGAIPGALPPLIGWAGAEGGISALGWILFAILLFWQIPHFMALAWTYRKDYEQGGFPMGSVVDPSGKRIARESFGCTLLLMAVSLLPFVLGFTTLFYAVVAGICGLWFLHRSVKFLSPADRSPAARKLFTASIAYLPIVLGALVIDRILLV